MFYKQETTHMLGNSNITFFEPLQTPSHLTLFGQYFKEVLLKVLHMPHHPLSRNFIYYIKNLAIYLLIFGNRISSFHRACTAKQFCCFLWYQAIGSPKFQLKLQPNNGTMVNDYNFDGHFIRRKFLHCTKCEKVKSYT